MATLRRLNILIPTLLVVFITVLRLAESVSITIISPIKGETISVGTELRVSLSIIYAPGEDKESQTESLSVSTYDGDDTNTKVSWTVSGQMLKDYVTANEGGFTMTLTATEDGTHFLDRCTLGHDLDVVLSVRMDNREGSLVIATEPIQFKVTRSIVLHPPIMQAPSSRLSSSLLTASSKRGWRRIEITPSNINRTDRSRYSPLVRNIELAEGWDFWSGGAGAEHYDLFAYLSKLMPRSTLVDIGTNHGKSAFAFASEPTNRVLSYDVVPRRPYIAEANGLSEARLARHVPNVAFRTRNFLEPVLNNTSGCSSSDILNPELEEILSAAAISLDTAHVPEEDGFEYAMVNFLMKHGYQGILIADDIYWSAGMIAWWRSVPPTLVRYDFTAFGHSAGTGVIDFGGTMVVQACKELGA